MLYRVVFIAENEDLGHAFIVLQRIVRAAADENAAPLVRQFLDRVVLCKEDFLFQRKAHGTLLQRGTRAHRDGIQEGTRLLLVVALNELFGIAVRLGGFRDDLPVIAGNPQRFSDGETDAASCGSGRASDRDQDLLLILHGILPFRLALGLNGGDGDHADDVFRGAAAGQIVDRCRDTLADRSVGLCLCESLYKLVADIAGVKIRENEDVGAAGDRRFGRFALTDLRNDGGIQLKLAVDQIFRILFLRDADGFLHLGDVENLIKMMIEIKIQLLKKKERQIFLKKEEKVLGLI